ncbi:isoprenylcysteine carboxylmethyltransferase family protein [Halocella sp. SP3-1]|uniref:methyltransferase family protein n=1 Tax=Halocella sp. SP3-1 TaxID=2382161 RepID=UPI000F764223|nr:isoprenylcysteine carboxylmethyltransferase family protein [Halocella sp. SP3-1]AZO96303.1 isoprenylcysteine carboxylmethyltransferase family protein [Halocella sp. SP3-1]
MKIIEYYLNLKPNIMMSFGFILIIFIGFLGEYFSWARIPYQPLSNIIGGIIFITGWLFHKYCHSFHKKAHLRSDQIKSIIKSGPFAIIRHPMYLSLILMYLGVSMTWGIIWMFIPFIVFSSFIIIIAIREETYLLNELGSEYKDYIDEVSWRFIPKLF